MTRTTSTQPTGMPRRLKVSEILLGVTPHGVDDVKHFLMMHSVGDTAKRIGYNDNFLFRPYEFQNLAPLQIGSLVVKRAAFNVDRTLVGGRLRLSADTLGQVALMRESGTEHLSLAAVVPVKTGILAPVSETVRRQAFESNPDDDGALHAAVSEIVYDVLQGVDSK